MTPREAIRYLVEKKKLTHPKILALLLDRGVKTTQPTISRIGSGSIKDPQYTLGAELVNLASDLK